MVDIVAHLKRQGKPSYIEDITKEDESDSGNFGGGDIGGDDSTSLYDQAVAIVLRLAGPITPSDSMRSIRSAARL